MEDRDYVHEHRDKNESKFKRNEFPCNSKTLNKSSIAGSELPDILDLLAKPAVAWIFGVMLGAVLGIIGTVLAAIVNIDLLSLPFKFAHHILNLFA